MYNIVKDVASLIHSVIGKPQLNAIPHGSHIYKHEGSTSPKYAGNIHGMLIRGWCSDKRKGFSTVLILSKKATSDPLSRPSAAWSKPL